jgi:hypothetical protein
MKSANRKRNYDAALIISFMQSFDEFVFDKIVGDEGLGPENHRKIDAGLSERVISYKWFKAFDCTSIVILSTSARSLS